LSNSDLPQNRPWLLHGRPLPACQHGCRDGTHRFSKFGPTMLSKSNARLFVNLFRNGTFLETMFRGLLMLVNYFSFLVYERAKFAQTYGKFTKVTENHVFLDNESGRIDAHVIQAIKTLRSTKALPDNARILLDCETESAKQVISSLAGKAKVFSCGLSTTFDFNWDFNDAPPREIGLYDMIISQAVFEHLLNPYQHFADLRSLLYPGGILVVAVPIPGYYYHRYPIDSFRFYPDWFEEMSTRFQMKILDKYCSLLLMTYILKIQ
jgi:hypothetical protein